MMMKKKAQMGNMLHLVIIAVVILIAAMAIILMVTRTTGDVGDSTSAQSDAASTGIDTTFQGITRGCPGKAFGSTDPVTACVGHSYELTGSAVLTTALGGGAAAVADGQKVCCTSKDVDTLTVQGTCEHIHICNPTV